MRREITIIDGEYVLPLPVPCSFELEDGIDVETVSLTNFGEVKLAGNKILNSTKFESFFPAQEYPFSKKTDWEPYDYIDYFKASMAIKKVVRVIISGTNINRRVLIEDIVYGEKDGTNDVYYTLTLTDYTEPEAPRLNGATDADTAQGARTDEAAAGQTEIISYTVTAGDSLCKICRQFYGNENLYAGLKKYNGLKSNIIHVGDVLKIPPASEVGG